MDLSRSHDGATNKSRAWVLERNNTFCPLGRGALTLTGAAGGHLWRFGMLTIGW
jgi:hypothetical protein